MTINGLLAWIDPETWSHHQTWGPMKPETWIDPDPCEIREELSLERGT
jgi:hypothetical protein